MCDAVKVSIITPSYNQGQFLRETIESVLNQDYSNVEYFIIDGGSTDNSVEIIREYEDRIDWWISEKDGGQSDAIQKGFQKATGDLVGWLNSDDVLKIDAVSSVVACYLRHPEATLFYGDAFVIDESGNIVGKLRASNRLTFNSLLNGRGKLIQQGSFYRRQVVEQVGGMNTELYLLMDRDLWLRLLKHGDGFHVGRPVAYFRHHGAAKSNQPPFMYIKEAIKIAKTYGTRQLSWRTFTIFRLRIKCLCLKWRIRTVNHT